MRIDTQVRNNDVSIKINVEDETAAKFIDSFYPEFQERMLGMGFNLSAKCCVAEAEEMKDPDDLHQLMVDHEMRLVDVKT